MVLHPLMLLDQPLLERPLLLELSPLFGSELLLL
jgi:hypothetical protein